MSDLDELRVIIVDDEPLARAVVREYLAALDESQAPPKK